MLDRRWGTGRWPFRDEDEWESWWDGLTEDDWARGLWHGL
jgi:hypothetical protein